MESLHYFATAVGFLAERQGRRIVVFVSAMVILHTPSDFAETTGYDFTPSWPLRAAGAVVSILMLAGCGDDVQPGEQADGRSSYKVGGTYTIAGVRSIAPNENYSYNESGIASWYGPGFHGKPHRQWRDLSTRTT